jgi:hypothetical protein
MLLLLGAQLVAVLRMLQLGKPFHLLLLLLAVVAVVMVLLRVKVMVLVLP